MTSHIGTRICDLWALVHLCLLPLFPVASSNRHIQLRLPWVWLLAALSCSTHNNTIKRQLPELINRVIHDIFYWSLRGNSTYLPQSAVSSEQGHLWPGGIWGFRELIKDTSAGQMTTHIILGQGSCGSCGWTLSGWVEGDNLARLKGKFHFDTTCSMALIYINYNTPFS